MKKIGKKEEKKVRGKVGSSKERKKKKQVITLQIHGSYMVLSSCQAMV